MAPTVTREQATDLFSLHEVSVWTRLSRQRTSPTSIEMLFIPYFRFGLQLAGATTEPSVCVAVDGLIGEGVFFLTEVLEFALCRDEQRCTFELSETTAREIVLDQYGRLLLEHGLRNKSTATIESISEAEEMLYPFWIGYFRKGDSYDFKSMDAVSGEIQGVRMRKVFLAAFRQLESH